MKLRPNPTYRTKAILLHDDDVHYTPIEMELAFQVWRQQGQYRVTGAFARCVVMGSDGKWKYKSCGNGGYYNMVLTGLLFTHISFLEYYSSEDPMMSQIRDYVDKVFNCEDVAFNYMAAMLSCTSALQVTGPQVAFDARPPGGISTSAKHKKTRHECVDDFKNILGYMPLKNSAVHFGLGSKG
ncbi:hypothetical protein G7Z17_g5353 [Cylindrodendrum hubeiense]|uniref:Glycosyl transferase 64 domain-containing protein n=1 Tax=Cylindrodendrum hubeiense TaxID=595255 RepID=A0A9P5LBT4_9HYPO|nr:hypothetical protein G7Z17_g5353 [Cylindrodendrum hubeiense]